LTNGAGVQRDVREDLADDGLDAGIVWERLTHQGQQRKGQGLNNHLALLRDGRVRQKSLEAIFY